MNSWKWSNGETYYKSARCILTKKEEIYDSCENAINQALNCEENIEQDSYTRNSNSSVNKREELDNKIADRILISQRGVNPFLQQSSYVNDVVNRDIFLKPLNTSKDKINIEQND